MFPTEAVLGTLALGKKAARLQYCLPRLRPQQMHFPIQNQMGNLPKRQLLGTWDAGSQHPMCPPEAFDSNPTSSNSNAA